MIELNYGKYPIPETLKQIISLKNQLKKEGKLSHGNLLGYYFSLADIDSRYLNTPLDVVEFANPGADGIHFGFLTDFGQVDDLENAYIVRVSPMDFDEPVKIVARNLYDFMRMICFSPGAVEFLDIYTSETDYERLVHEIPSLSLSQIENDQQRDVNKVFQMEFQLQPIKHIYDYLQQIKKERMQATVLPTEDGIGVVNKKEQKQHQHFPLKRQVDLELHAVIQFFEGASYESKLEFLRNAQSKGLLYDNDEIKNYLKKKLRLMGLNDEAERISYPEL
ncbi:hypothetical protein [Neobacillus sp. NPDC093127]|uniref:hypothetical protein n=1 Tax=Neobacillus sp. NPDC093127 TaxID=3364296 RepID=UPI00382D1603